jgi:hypothetical protein
LDRKRDLNVQTVERMAHNAGCYTSVLEQATHKLHLPEGVARNVRLGEKHFLFNGRSVGRAVIGRMPKEKR